MATGRTLKRWTRVYADGYDLSGYSRSIGPLLTDFNAADVTADMGDNVRGYLCDQPNISPGTLNAIFDNTATTGLKAAMSTPAVRNLMVPIGIRAAPAAGDPVFMGRFHQGAMQASGDAGAVVATIPFGNWEAAGLINYTKAWGTLLHAKAAETAANAANGIDDNGAASAVGGYMMYQIFTSDAAGTATISIEDSVLVGGAYAALAGATTAAIGFASIPCAGIIALGTAVAVRRHLRWQLALAGGMTTCTFALSFVRG